MAIWIDQPKFAYFTCTFYKLVFLAENMSKSALKNKKKRDAKKAKAAEVSEIV